LIISGAKLTVPHQAQPALSTEPPAPEPELDPEPPVQSGEAEATLAAQLRMPETGGPELREPPARQHWTQRPHGDLTDTALRELLEREQHQGERDKPWEAGLTRGNVFAVRIAG